MWLVGGKPASTSASGSTKSYAFRVNQMRDELARSAVAFDEAWTLMRDYYYDESMGGTDWQAMRTKYRPLAAQAATGDELESVIDAMLGELNGSHLGFSSTRRGWRKAGWKPTTLHLGVRFDRDDGGEGLLVSEVIPDGPAIRNDSRIDVGERLLSINETSVSRDTNLVPLLTGELQRDVRAAHPSAPTARCEASRCVPCPTVAFADCSTTPGVRTRQRASQALLTASSATCISEA